MKRKIRGATEQLEGLSIKEYLQQEGIKVYATDTIEKGEDAYLCGNKIFIRKHLPRNYRKFVLLHELGHYLMHKDDSLAFSFALLGYRNKLEVEADTFACQVLLKDEYLEDVNIIDLLERKGVPGRIARKFYESWYRK